MSFEDGIITGRDTIVPEGGQIYIVTDKNGRQIIGWMDLPKGMIAGPGVCTLKDPMVCGEKIEQRSDGVLNVNLVVMPIFRSVLIPEIVADVVSLIVVDKTSKMATVYEETVEESRLSLRAAQSGLQTATSMPTSPPGLFGGRR